MYDQRVPVTVQWFHAGEIVTVALVPRNRTDRNRVHEEMHAALRPHAADHLAPDPTGDRSFVFNAPNVERSLVFSFHRLRDESPGAVKRAAEALRQQHAIELIGVMPHFHIRAHDAGSGPSPGTYPRPVYPDQVPDRWRYRFYQPINPALDINAAADSTPVPVAVLDTDVNLRAARETGERLQQQAGNPQLVETVRWVQDHTKPDQRYQQEFHALATMHEADGQEPAGDPRPYPIPDHGLFIAGLIHGIAPRSPVSLEPVLEENGMGDLSLLLLGLDRLVNNKPETEPLIVNLSLGLLPHPARMAAAWYGLERPHDPDYHRVEDFFEPDRDELWVAANRREVDQTVDLLQRGLWELGRYLSLNNCLVVAATGNDSLLRVEAGHARMQPRLPARLETVLGVAATTSNPRVPAPYSNLGDERELGDHVATFGGNSTNGLQPEDGVIGVYAGEFPFGRPNETGWAFWSGTSFAAGIVSGIAANFWAARRGVHASRLLAELATEARHFGPYVPELRTSSIEVLGRWR